MPDINLENTVAEQAVASEQVPKKKRSTYARGLMNTWAFSQKLSEFSIIFKLILILARLFTFVFYSLFFVLNLIVSFIVDICKKSKPVKWIVIVLLVLCTVGLLDFAIFYGKIYPGIHVGELDLSGKTAEEAETLIDDTYSDRLSRNNVVISVNEETNWTTSAVDLEASLPTADLVDKALNSTRGIQNIFSRFGAMLFSQNIAPYVDFNDTAVLSQITKVNDLVGKAVVNPTCVIEGGQAVAKEGTDGLLVNNDEFIRQLNEAFFQEDPYKSFFIPNLYVTKQLVSYEAAKTLSEKINMSLQKQVSFNYKGNEWSVDKANLCNWIKVEVQDRSDEANAGCSCASLLGPSYCICALVDSDEAGAEILAHTRQQNMEATDYSIQMTQEQSGIMVRTQGNFEMPAINDAVRSLNEDWLDNAAVYENNILGASGSTNADAVKIDINSTKVPEVLSLDNALSIGVVSLFSSFTTTYSNGAGTENRNKNIDLGASSLNNSICKANGGRWSFNEVVGNTTADKGYLEAGTILGNRTTKSVGGGICQVATTVFNAVYDSGLAIPVRYNHDLHMSSYPAGRDAAINYPNLDLVWRNDEKSDILMTASTTGYSITVNLLGVNPGYTVKSEVGEWTPGDPYQQEYVVDPAAEPNSKKVQTSGADGKSIVVVRLVYNKNGELVRQDEFKSQYKPKSEIIVLGPGDEANQLLATHQARMKDETDNW